MTSTFKISLICNLALVGIVVFLLMRHQEKSTAPPPAPIPETTTPVAAATPAVPPESKPFQWTQLESTNDYREYIANLRAAGCPESTIEDIVHGDTERAFSFQRHKLNLDPGKPGPWSMSAEARLVAFLLGRAPAPNLADEPAAQPASEADATPPVYPLAFQDVNPDAMSLNQEEKQAFQNAIAGVRQQFINQIGGTNQDPADPAYLARWQKAQSQMDTILRAKLGGKIFNAYAFATARAAAQNSRQNP